MFPGADMNLLSTLIQQAQQQLQWWNQLIQASGDTINPKNAVVLSTPGILINMTSSAHPPQC